MPFGVTTFKFNIFPYYFSKIRKKKLGQNRQFQAKTVKYDSLRSISESMKPMYVKI